MNIDRSLTTVTLILMAVISVSYGAMILALQGDIKDCHSSCKQNASCHAECHKCCEELAAKVAALEKRQGAGAANE